MAMNEFKPFATDDGANVQEQSDYEQSEIIRLGFKEGLAKSSEMNKVLRQVSSVAAAIAEFAAEKSGKDMLDNGDVLTLRKRFEEALHVVSSLFVAEAQGSGDALTVSFSPAVTALSDGLLVHVRAREINGSPVPTFNANCTGARPIVKGNNLPLAAGDIAGAGHWLELQYDAALDKWVLGNPAKGVVTSSSVPAGSVMPFYRVTLSGRYPVFWGRNQADTGWLICDGGSDGQGGTVPDLRDRFVMGARGTGDAGMSGGSANVTTSSVTQGGTVGGTALTVEQMPGHNHVLQHNYGASTDDLAVHADIGTGGVGLSKKRFGLRNLNDATAYAGDVITLSSGGGGSHTHSFAGSVHSHTANVTPPYYKLIYCMKLLN